MLRTLSRRGFSTRDSKRVCVSNQEEIDNDNSDDHSPVLDGSDVGDHDYSMTPIYITAITGAAISAIVAGFPLAGSAPMTIAKND